MFGPKEQKHFTVLKEKLTNTLVLTLPDFNKIFEVDCNASRMGIRAFLSQEMKPIAFFSEKLSETRKKWSIYEQELYAIVRTLQQWEPYLIKKEFIINTDHQALKYLNSSSKANRMHARWIASIQKFTFSLKHKLGQLNKVADALSRRVMLLTSVRNEIIGFDHLKILYADDEDFHEEW